MDGTPSQFANGRPPWPLRRSERFFRMKAPMPPENDRSNREERIGVVLLAAGASSRMGTPKQLLKIGGVSLIRRAAEQALDSGCQPVVVVLGAKAELIAPELNGLAITIAVNGEWKVGMSSSIHC